MKKTEEQLTKRIQKKDNQQKGYPSGDCTLNVAFKFNFSLYTNITFFFVSCYCTVKREI